MTIGGVPGGSIADALGIGLDQFERRVDHLVAYAELTRSETDEPEPGGLLPAAAPGEARRSELLIDAASALREAAQLALVSSPERSADLLAQAGRLYLLASVPYGVYLIAMSGSMDGQVMESFESHLSNALRSIGHRAGRDESLLEDRGSPIGDASATPQQQIYLLLAGAASAIRSGRMERQLHTLSEGSPHRSSNQPVGALGIPAMRYWSAARALIEAGSESRGKVPPDDLTSVLEWLTRRHDDVSASARTNTYLWRNLASPIDIIDLDLVGLAALTMRRFGTGQVMEVLGERIGRRLPVEFLQVQLATHWSD